MSRSTSQSSSTTTTTASAPSRSLSVKTNNKTVVTANPHPPADARLFVTNLRLLDLDLRDDWPGITVQTLSSKTADQKQRISGVEWALFHLFALWNPDETSQKLQPFYPPLEPLQSLNLRAALYRCLNELKKNGVLGRHSVLRKTMLDECKGDKFFEVLSLFSTAVLKKVLAAKSDDTRKLAVARRISTATTLSPETQASMLPLAIAHKAALVNVLKKKEERRRRYRDFARTLGAKSDEIKASTRTSIATPRSEKPPITQEDARAFKNQVQENWVGNQAWLDTILYGHSADAGDAFLQMPFKEVWRMVEDGQDIADAVPEAGLLASLQLRVEEQKSRLATWKKFHESLLEEHKSSMSQEEIPTPLKKEFKFEEHLDLQIPASTSVGDGSSQSPPLGQTYHNIITSMDAELVRASQAQYNRSAAPILQRRGSSFSISRSPARRRISRSDSMPKKPPYPSMDKSDKQTSSIKKQSRERATRQPPHMPTATPIDSDATLVDRPSAQSIVEEQPSIIETTSDCLPTGNSSPHEIQLSPPHHQPYDPSFSSFPSEPPVIAPPTQTQEDDLAEQIISSIDSATPTPLKKQSRMSLIERTRLSMAHNSTFQPIDESPLPNSMPSPELPTQQTVQLDRRASLLERTRLSMAAMSKNPRTAHSEKEKRKSSARLSLFPVNQFDTPRARKSFEAIEEAKSGSITPKEILFSDDIDYERIFKSRPRIAQSPVFSTPVKGFRDDENEENGEPDSHMNGLGGEEYDEGVTGIDLGDVDADEDAEGFTQAWEHSPLRRAGGGFDGKSKLF